MLNQESKNNYLFVIDAMHDVTFCHPDLISTKPTKHSIAHSLKKGYFTGLNSPASSMVLTPTTNSISQFSVYFAGYCRSILLLHAGFDTVAPSAYLPI